MTEPQGDPGSPHPGQGPEFVYPDYSGYPPGAGQPGYGWYPQAPGHPAQPPPYGGYPVYGAYPPPVRDTNIWSILALISALTIPPLAIVAGHVALSQIKRTGDQGRGMAIAGLVIGYAFTLLIVLMTVFVVWMESSREDEFRDYRRDYTYSMSVTSDLADPDGRGPLPLSSV